MAFLKVFAFCLARLPLNWQWGFGVFLGWLWWDVFRLRRFTLYRNITIVYPHLPKDERVKLIKKSLSWMGFHLIETLQIPAVQTDWLNRRIVIEGAEHFKAAQAQNKGVLLLSLHLGNGDMGAAGLSVAGYPLHLISKKFKIRFLNDTWFGLRETKGTRFIAPHGKETAFQILKALKAKEAVVFVMDQFMGRPYGIPTKFFGVPTATAYGLALFATKTRAPVLTVYTYHDPDLVLHVAFGPEIEFEEVADKDLQMERMTQKYNSVLEKLILSYPEHWMWVHRRWKRWE